MTQYYVQYSKRRGDTWLNVLQLGNQLFEKRFLDHSSVFVSDGTRWTKGGKC